MNDSELYWIENSFPYSMDLFEEFLKWDVVKTFMTVNSILRFFQEVNFSHNRMTKMKDLSAYSYLSKLDLDRILTERHLHSSKSLWTCTHTHFLCLCLFLSHWTIFFTLYPHSLLIYYNVYKSILSKRIMFTCISSLCAILNMAVHQTTVSARSVVLSSVASSPILAWHTTRSQESVAWAVYLSHTSAL